MGRPHARMRKDRLVTEGLQDLAQRLAKAARATGAVRMPEPVAGQASLGGEALRIASLMLGQRPATGGAGRGAAGTDVPRPADLVTDDERDGLIGGRDAASRDDDGAL